MVGHGLAKSARPAGMSNVHTAAQPVSPAVRYRRCKRTAVPVPVPVEKNHGSAGAAETFRSGSPPAAILLPPLLMHFIWSNYDFSGRISPESYL